MARKTEEDLIEDAMKTFAEHEIRSRSDTSVLICRRHKDGGWTSDYAMEIVSGALGYLILTGDMDTVLFAYCKGSLREKLQWIGKDQPSLGYISQKASIGMNESHRLARSFSPEVAAEIVEDQAQTMSADGEHEVAAALREAIEFDLPEDEYSLRPFLEKLEEAGLSDVGELASSFYVTAPRVVYAWAACRRARQLLDAADAASEASG